MPRGIRIIDRDRGWKALLRRTKPLQRTHAVKVGVLSGAGAMAGAGGLSTLDVASVHEFGLGDHPERSFIRAWADADREKHRDAERLMAESVVRGKNTASSALEKLGVLLAAESQKFIADGRVSPPTAGEGKTTLVDKGQLKGSISHEVE